MSGDLDYNDVHSFNIKWSIDFDSFGSYETKVKSPIIFLGNNRNKFNTKWQLWMTRKKGGTYHEGYLTIKIESLNDWDITALVTIAILNKQDEIFQEHAFPNHLFTKSTNYIPLEDVIKISYTNMKNNQYSILKDNKFRIKFKINIDYSQTVLQKVEKKFCRLKQFDMLENLFLDQESSDIIINAGEKKFYVHKNILITFSPVFKAMFQHDFLEKTKNEVKIVDIQPEVLEEFFRFFYTGKVNKIDDIKKELLYAAEKYSVEGLKQFCEDYLLGKICQENVIEYLELAVKCNATNLKNYAIKFINYHSTKLWKKEELKSLGSVYPDILFEIMNSTLK